MSVAGHGQQPKANITNKLDGLQVLRGFAALLIVVFHAIHEINRLYAEQGTSFSALFHKPDALIYGIDLFFVISGFIMVYTAYGKTGAGAAKRFIARRAVRIIPLYWFYTALLLLLFIVMPNALNDLSVNIAQLFKSFFFIPYTDATGGLYPFLKIGWTLNYEMYFYLIFALFLFLPPRFMMPALTAFFLITVLLKEYVLPEGVIRDFYGRDIVLNFLTGAWVGYAYIKGLRLPRRFIWAGGALIVLSVLWALFEPYIRGAFDIKMPLKTLAALIVLLVVLPKGADDFHFPRLWVFLGDSSYSLYLAHSFALGALMIVLGTIGASAVVSPWIIFILCVIVSIIAGSISYLLIEKPLLSTAKRLMYRGNTEKK